jgi:UDP-galactopyranose mutase
MREGDLPPEQKRLFRSFWMGGYEGADHVNSRGIPLNINEWNGHSLHTSQDYSRLAAMGIRTIRESIGWRASTDNYGKVDLTNLRHRAQLAQAHNLQVIWTIHHYGLPPGVDFFSKDFADRFADFCFQVSALQSVRGSLPHIYQPINEISFLTWAVTCSSLMHPYAGNSPQHGYDLKCYLVAAALKGCDEIWANEPSARIVHTDPIIHVVAEVNAQRHELEAAQRVGLRQFEAWDMLSGAVEPSLGGAPRYLWQFTEWRPYGKLPYRSLRFVHSTIDQAQYQSTAVVNYPSLDVPHTRITPFRLLKMQLSINAMSSWPIAPKG